MGMPPKKPIIAAIDGQALAGGMEMVLSCDLIVATQDVGVRPGRGQARPARDRWRLLQIAAPRPVSRRNGNDPDRRNKNGGRNVRARSRQQSGARPATRSTAHSNWRASSRATRPVAVKAAKEIAFRSAAELWTDADGWKKQQEPSRAVMQSEDLQEGLRAFAEKRDPVWKGK